MTDAQLGRLIGQGRDADIFAHGDRHVLRRSREGRTFATEAAVMEYVRSYGYPAPAVESVSDDGREIVMERVVGRDMVGALERRPWMARRFGVVLGELHNRLHEIEAPAWMSPAPVGAGSAVVHLDLHPLNVMMGAHGPVVIDWTNARAGDGHVDVALTWILTAIGDVPLSGLVARGAARCRASLLAGFLATVDHAGARRSVPDVARWKALDAHMSPNELDRLLAIAEGRTPLEAPTRRGRRRGDTR